MENTNLDNFEIKWEQALKQPPVKQVDVQKIEADISVSTILDRFLLIAERSLKQGKIEKADYDDLVVHTSNLKKVLTKIKEKDLVNEEMAKRAKLRELKHKNSKFI
jgi:hypothetical protein